MLVNSCQSVKELLARFPQLVKEKYQIYEDTYFLDHCFRDGSWRFGEEKLLQGKYCPFGVLVK
jgi:hypothetical protein